VCGPKRKAPGRSPRNSPINIRLIKLHDTCKEGIKNAYEILVGET
jgi:hypothetical protein